MVDTDRSEVRREAFRAAAGAVDRFLERVGDPVPTEVGELGKVAWDRFRSELARVVDLNLEMVRNAFGLYGTLLGPEMLKPDGAGARLAFGSGVPGSEVSAVLWLHNFEDDAMEEMRLVGSDLSAGSGARIEGPAWTFAPAVVALPPRSATPVLVTLPIPSDADAGSYRGTIGPAGREGPSIDADVDVVSMDPVPHDSW